MEKKLKGLMVILEKLKGLLGYIEEAERVGGFIGEVERVDGFIGEVDVHVCLPAKCLPRAIYVKACLPKP